VGSVGRAGKGCRFPCGAPVRWTSLAFRRFAGADEQAIELQRGERMLHREGEGAILGEPGQVMGGPARYFANVVSNFAAVSKNSWNVWL